MSVSVRVLRDRSQARAEGQPSNHAIISASQVFGFESFPDGVFAAACCAAPFTSSHEASCEPFFHNVLIWHALGCSLQSPMDTSTEKPKKKDKAFVQRLPHRNGRSAISEGSRRR